MSEIACTPEVVGNVARGLKALSAMAGEYASFSVSTGASAGYPHEALTQAAQKVAEIAVSERDLIDKALDNIVADMADYCTCDLETARELLGLGG